MRILIACEESQRVCLAFRKCGHDSFSCDILPPSGGHPEYHILGDALTAIQGGKIVTMDGVIHDIGQWDLIIAHPPCTYLANSGTRWFNIDRYGEKALQRYKLRDSAVRFFMSFVYAECDKIAIENPIGFMSTFFRKPDQIIQPYQFGFPARKSTCLWLKGLPKLQATEIVDYKLKTKNFSDGLSAAWATDDNGKILRWNDPETAKQRSKTVPGIALAMALQWG